MYIHEAGFCLHFRGSQTGQNGLLEFACNAAASRNKGLEHRMVAVPGFEKVCDNMRDVVDAGAAQCTLIQQADGLLQVAAAVFEVSGWASHDGDEALKEGGDELAGPRVGHADRDAVHILKTGSIGHEPMVMSVERQHGQDLAGAQSNAHIDHPDETIGGPLRVHG